MRDKRGVRRSPWTLPHGQSLRRQPTGINSQPALQGRCIFKSFGCKQLRRPYTRKSCRMDAQTLAAPGLRDASALPLTGSPSKVGTRSDILSFRIRMQMFTVEGFPMLLDKVFAPFVKEKPICVMARAVLQRLLDPQ